MGEGKPRKEKEEEEIKRKSGMLKRNVDKIKIRVIHTE